MSKTPVKKSPSPFVLDTESTFWWPVIVPVPSAATPGKKDDMRFLAEFAHITQEERIELLTEHRQELKRIAKEDPDEQMVAVFNLSQRTLNRVFCGFKGVVDRDGEPVPVSDEARTSLITHQMVWPRIWKSYCDAIGQQDSRGN